ncbi:MAG: ATP-binding cassette domain-containing protein [Bacteroidaceae bacterium]|jgi:ABC-type lipoprotein export system ATPase subunit|nr:ATP-binding cassette domain-containing protein [Bacteroidaceae bacterium]
MNTIILKHTLPQVFAQRSDIISDVWLKDIIFEKGKTYLLEANSGTGKSSLCSFVYGYRKDYQGRIFFDEQNILQLTVKQWVDQRKKHLSLLWQDLRLFPELSAFENVQLKNKLTGFQKKKTIEEWFDRLGIDDKKNALVGQMSFGQQQRVALIRALCQPFDFLFADEPVSHLDDSNSQIMADILQEEVEKQGAGLIVTSIGKRMELPYDAVLRL